MFDDDLWKSFVYRTFSNVKYQDLCATINPGRDEILLTFSSRPKSVEDQISSEPKTISKIYNDNAAID